jgi:hypothetical protein
MATILQATAEPATHAENNYLSASSASSARSAVPVFDLVEAGAGNGRLSADILRALRDRHPELYPHVRLHLIEASAAARDAQQATLGDVRDRLSNSSASLPNRSRAFSSPTSCSMRFPCIRSSCARMG